MTKYDDFRKYLVLLLYFADIGNDRIKNQNLFGSNHNQSEKFKHIDTLQNPSI